MHLIKIAINIIQFSNVFHNLIKPEINLINFLNLWIN